ncbi:AgmX/PglI C-terminal domain-containing protein [Nannocystis sp.]|uniref:AgmX/PglI C-terminal domain-containing protein n=1 Tax=Nannocystis sp. TaxID=1962667 RepID=UPI0025F199F5|nr:AgmX/PglI C-terminal domain-containing protein [Nannocystis sp.]MBK7826856.1 AgmX/PglI C-terminal domain-containing protein [Nannocystis sp.]
MSLRTCIHLAGSVLALAACTPTHSGPVDEAPPPPVDPSAEFGPAPPPSYLPRQTLRPGDRDLGRAPVSLTASDGTGLRLVSLKARAVVEEPLAFTELHLVFENPNDRTIEGRFEIDMPPNAAISRFTMKVRGAWQEGEVVERQAAQRAYEDFLHRKQDPALLENKAGNAFSARVFPILPHERKELIVAYSQELPSSAEPYRLPLRGLPELDELDASVILNEPIAAPAGVTTSIATTTTGSRRVIELKKQKWTPDQDLEVLDDRGFSMMGLRHDNLAVARVAAVGATLPAPISRLTVLFDTSASRALGFERQVERMHATLAALRAVGDDFDLRLIAFDQDTQEIYSGKASGLGPAQLKAIVDRGAFGASDLERALQAVGTGADSIGRVLVFSDGISTAGDAELTALQAAARNLSQRGTQRIDAIIDGGIQDAEVLRQIATAELLSHGVVLDARLPQDNIVRKLTTTTLADMKVTVPGARWTWPDTLRGLQPGDEALVYADLPETAAMRVILTGDDRIDVSVPTRPVERPLLERAWVGARIERLTSMRSALPASDHDIRNAFQSQIVGLSTRFRVLSDFTALLVLETEDDYRRFNIDRNALTDILAVDASGVTLINRRAAAPAALANTGPGAEAPLDSVIPQMARSFDPEMAARQAGILGLMQAQEGHFLASPYGGAFAVGNDNADVWGGLTGTEIGDAYGVGGLGLVGTGRGGGGTGEGTIGLGTGSGYGRGAGAGFGGRNIGNPPTVRQAKAEVQGSLDKDIIRRIVRSHINEVRYCYVEGLSRVSGLRGRVAVRFVIGGDGKVVESTLSETTLADDKASQCVARAVKTWAFPTIPGGGQVIVTYPFVFDGGDPVGYAVPDTYEAYLRNARREEARRAREEAREEARERREAAAQERIEAAERKRKREPVAGEMAEVLALVAAGKHDAALTRAQTWHSKDPGDVLALLALGEVHEAAMRPAEAARAYGSIIDLFPSRADLRRYAGARLERLGAPGLALAVDTFKKAVAQRPDHPASHRLLAFALARAGRHEEALAAILVGLGQTYPGGRFRGVDRILRDDVAILAAVRIAHDPASEKAVRAELDRLHITVADAPSLRFVLNWETDANDVDFHIVDGKGQEAFFSHRQLDSGGELFDDVTTGYGPECFAIPGTPSAYPYKLSAHYYSRGPMGYGMGKLQVMQHDGKGELRFDERPFVIMQDGAFVQLGSVTGPLK